jgi:alkaline phosphatase D
LLLDFLDEPASSPRYERGGTYATYTFGDDGGGGDSGGGDFRGGVDKNKNKNKNQSVRVVLLDNRYFASARGVEDGDLIGEEQWQWLRRTLKENTAPLVIVGSGGS